MTPSKNPAPPANAKERWQSIWQRLTEPAEAIQEVGARRQARLLSSLLLILLPLGINAIIGAATLGAANMVTSTIMLLIEVIAYGLSRTKYYITGAILLLPMFSLGAFVTVIVNGDYSSDGLLRILLWFTLPLLLGSVFFTMRQMVIFIAFLLFGLLALPLLVPLIPFSALYHSISFILTTSLLFLIAIHHRNQVEHDRLALLEARGIELSEARDGLERRVAERTAELAQANQQLALKIEQQQQAEAELAASLHEKEVLLKEIHHRVKNNLQIISSILYLQSDQIKEQATLEIFKESQNRVKSMALIHEQLYQTDNLARINLADYIERLTNHLSHSYGANHISLQLNIEPLFLSIDTAIPCGLIINELVTNALKYAFPDQPRPEKRAAQIWVAVQPSDNQHLTLSVRDNGVGFPADINVYRPRSLGLTLVTTLVKQLKGSLQLQSENGTEFKIRFSNSSIKREGQTHESNAHPSG